MESLIPSGGSAKRHIARGRLADHIGIQSLFGGKRRFSGPKHFHRPGIALRFQADENAPVLEWSVLDISKRSKR